MSSGARDPASPLRHIDAILVTTVVLIVSAIIGALLGFADMGFSWIVEQTILR